MAILHVDEKDLVFGAVENNLNLALFEDDNFSQRSIITDEIITAPLAVEFISSSEILIYSGLNDGSIQIFEYDQLNDRDPNLIQTVQTLNSPVSQIVYHSGNLFAAGGNNFYFAGKQIQFDEKIKSFAVTKQSSGELISLILTEQNLMYSYNDDSD